MTLENAHKLPNGRLKFLHGFESPISPVKKQTHEKENPPNLARVACVAKVSDHKQLKILILK